MIRLTVEELFELFFFREHFSCAQESRVKESLSVQDENSFRARNQLNGERMHV